MHRQRKIPRIEELNEPRPLVTFDSPAPWFQIDPPTSFVWQRAQLPIDDLPPALDGLRLVHLSDFHLRRRWARAFDTLSADLAARPPDLLLITGDFVENRRQPFAPLPVLQRLGAALKSRLGAFAVLGNHDRQKIRPHLRQAGITLLDLRPTILDTGAGATVELLGLPWHRRTHFDSERVRAVPPRQPGRPRITLGHFPDFFPRSLGLDTDLYLCGHTHGGQICLPGGFPILRHDPSPRRWCRGIHRLGRSWFVVTRGMGMTGLRVRMFCAAEAVEITLRQRQSNK